jgi:hypothetical protein
MDEHTLEFVLLARGALVPPEDIATAAAAVETGSWGRVKAMFR